MSLYGESLYGVAVYGSVDDAPEGPPASSPLTWRDNRIEYHPPVGDPLVICYSPHAAMYARLLVMETEGLEGASRSAHELAAPGQYGTSLTGAAWPSRIVGVVVAVRGDDDAHRRNLVANIERACFVEPGSPALGRLRVFHDGRPAVEADALPVDEPGRTVTRQSQRWSLHRINFLVPSGLFRSITSRAVFLGGTLGGEYAYLIGEPGEGEGEGGGEYVYVLGGEGEGDGGEYVLSGNTSLDLAYEGVAPAPIIVDFSGAMEGPRLIVTGPGSRSEEIAVDVELQAGERLQVTTGRGQVSARLFSGGVWSDAGDLIDNVATRPWLLRPGLQTVSLAATVNTSGTARLAWHDWFPSP